MTALPATWSKADLTLIEAFMLLSDTKQRLVYAYARQAAMISITSEVFAGREREGDHLVRGAAVATISITRFIQRVRR
jgi:hypothetical protein